MQTGEDLLGVVSAQVVVDEAGLDAAMADDHVWLVDLSVEHYGRINRAATDVVMNDLFWKHAGWSK